MPKEAVLIFPNQLFKKHPALKKGRLTFLIEEPHFFGKNHKQKILMHRASMRHYCNQTDNTIYIEHGEADTIESELIKEKVEHVFCADPIEKVVKRKYEDIAKKLAIEWTWLESPSFLTTTHEFNEFFDDKKRYHQTDFYIWQRRRLDILMDADKPQGGSWTFDTENRKKLPKTVSPPPSIVFPKSAYFKEASEYIQNHFPNNPGEIDSFNYPITHADAINVLDNFLEQRLLLFGPFQDAMTTRSENLFHSLISAPLNIGLLTPDQVIHETLRYAKGKRIPLASLEGFIRQVIGWREFIRAIYEREEKTLRSTNFFNHKKKLEKVWYSGDTGIDPIDHVIKKVAHTAYAHHIERLMLIGNFMLLTELDPKQIYLWFMEMFIDSYDWVMLPNVYSMSQYADGGLIVTKPYISSSNYVLKMSDYKRGQWCAIWDALYWNFLMKHRKQLETNPRMSMMYRILDKMSDLQKKQHKEAALKFLK